MLILHHTPTLWRLLPLLRDIDPYKIVRSYQAVQQLRDMLHLALLTVLFIAQPVLVPQAVIVYFVLDIVYHPAVFCSNRLYLLHHVFAVAQITYMINTTTEHNGTHRFAEILIYVNELGLVPIVYVDVLRLVGLPVSNRVLLTRAMVYGSTRALAYTCVWCYRGFFELTVCLPLVFHNCYVFWLQCRACRARYVQPLRHRTLQG